ncbi:MAG: cytochrome c [Candidatus Marinimicrobia bacterium]|nr:cytochrome c [Candidatus Neomarinimicrobiota bacterium]MBT3679449.1 cytochrome c [Candidatus Neomarinimicrobiota bacterium]MBT3951082.1 cytochrome c [Candidatus Neomarinimicrobiota bacterium]MBT4254238.1 cytochrome c [Candidatus Neomarinimicrobiota bacterium]MBT4479419.1 cytochrome c [Candidatus Neomarinimicrobiota bacterium]
MNKLFTRMMLFTGIAFLVMTCGRGNYSEKTPIHLNPNMDSQGKYKAQSESNFFVDGASMRTPVEGTVARGELRADDAFYHGKDASGEFITSAPMDVTAEMVLRGEERYDIYCSACHGVKADGKGKILFYEYPIPPANFYDERIKKLSDGHMFNAITAGWLNMPSFKAQVSVEDRWAIISYIRSLQKN